MLLISNSRRERDNRPDIRSNDRIGFKLLPVLLNNIIHTSRKFHANRLNIKEVYPEPDIWPDIRLDNWINFKLSPIL